MTRHRRPQLRLYWLCVPACLLLLLPFVTLLQETPWRSFTLTAGDLASVRVSLLLGLAAMLLIAALGTALAFWLARTKSAMRKPVDALVMAAMLTPPLAMGILLVSAYDPYSTLGKPLAGIGYLVSNNAGALILAQVYGGLAYYVLAASNAFEGVAQELEEAAQTMGATDLQVFTRVTLPLARPGLITGLAIARVRVIGEFGIVMTFAYFPQGIPMRLYVNLQNDGVDGVYVLIWILLIASLPLPLWAWSKRRPFVGDGPF